MKIQNISHHTFFGNYLSKNSVVFDCGVNYGNFSLGISKKHGCTILGFEPDPRLFSKLPLIKNCDFYQLAVSNKNEVLNLNLGNKQCSSLIFKEKDSNSISKVNTIELESFCKQNRIKFINLLKLDIEGAEIQVLKSLEPYFLSNNIAQITVEFHEFMDKQVIPEIKDIIRKLKNNGYYSFRFSRTYGDVLFVNKKFIKLTFLQFLKINCYKYQKGISRVLKRHKF